ncbi:hypothetical protein HZC53_05060 [Candidatus Uhrbacteria bacterium]|nr:hypothetical protein [Candidatus Uhrbacteria bacterium]
MRFGRALNKIIRLDGAPEDAYLEFSRHVLKLRVRRLPEFIRSYVTDDLIKRHHLIPSATQRASCDPWILLGRALSAGDSKRGIRYRFEVSRDLNLAFQIMRWGYSVKAARASSPLEGYSQLEILMESLGQVDRLDDVTPISLHERGYPYRCRGVVLKETGEIFMTYGRREYLELEHEPCKFLNLRIGSARLPVLCGMRFKDPLACVAKMIADSQSDISPYEPWEAPDILGFRFMFRSKREMKQGGKYIRDRILDERTFKVSLGSRHGTVNSHSAAALLMLKGSINDRLGLLHLKGEIQCMLVRQHFDLIVSRTDINHELYHLRRYKDSVSGALAHWYPRSIYGLDWSSDEVGSKLEEGIRVLLPKPRP